MTHKNLDEKVLEAYTAHLNKHDEQSAALNARALQLCKKHQYMRGIGGCHALFAKVFVKNHEWNLALEEAKKACAFFERADDTLSLANQEYIIAYIYYRLEQNIRAIEHCSLALHKFKLIDDIRGEADTCSLLATILMTKAEYETSLEYLERSFNLKHQFGDLDGAGTDCINISAIYLYRNENEKAIKSLLQAIDLKERYKKALESDVNWLGNMVYFYNSYVPLRIPNDSTIADAYLNLGAALSTIGDYINAVEALDKALKIKQLQGDKNGMAIAYNQIGSIFLVTNDYSKAEWYFLQARPLFESLGRRHSEGTVWYNLGKIYLNSEKLDEANYALEKAEQLFVGLDIPYDELYIIQHKTELAIKTGKYTLAEQLIKSGLEVCKKIGASEFEVEFLMQFGLIKDSMNDYHSSISIYEDALILAQKQDLPPKVANILYTISILHKKHRNFTDAFARFEEFHSVQEQIIHAQAARHLSGMQVLHETEIHRKNEEIARTQITNLESLIKISNQSILLYKKEFNNLKSEILTITAQKDKEESLIRKIKMKLRESPLMQETWESYLEIFSRVNPDFQETLMNKYPNLTMMEERVCVLIRAGLMSDEIAEILSLSERTIENKRLRIRKKFGLGTKGSLSRFLIQL